MLLLVLLNLCFVSYMIYNYFLVYFVMFMISTINVCSLVYVIHRHYMMDYVIKLYYLEKCYFSQQILLFWDHIISLFPDVTFEFIECSNNTYDFYANYNITSFPTIIFNNNMFKDSLTFDNIVSFIEEKIE